MKMMEIPDNNDFRETLLYAKSKPTVFSNCIDDWPARKWTLPHLASVLKEQTVICRIGLKNKTDVQWETECVYKEISLEDFSEWVSMQCSNENPLRIYDRERYWIYVDYKYMKDVFLKTPHMLKELSWDRFGFPGRDGEQSTIWIGSEEAYTIGHYDTYGCNLVAQISGRKRWILFPNDQSDFLYPTRIPYEESSVFSEVNMSAPNLLKHPKLKLSTPYIVDLEPGQVLLVPRHWWHFVKCLEPAVSINTWIEMPEDNAERLKEALTRTVVCSMMPLDSTEADGWLNSNQEFFTLEENLHKVNDVMCLLKDSSSEFSSDPAMFVSGGLSSCCVKPQQTVSQITEDKQGEKITPGSGIHSPIKRVRLDSNDPPRVPELPEDNKTVLQKTCYTIVRNHWSVMTFKAVSFTEYMTSMLNITQSRETNITQENNENKLLYNIPDSQLTNNLTNRVPSQSVHIQLAGDKKEIQDADEQFISNLDSAKVQVEAACAITGYACRQASDIDSVHKDAVSEGKGLNRSLQVSEELESEHCVETVFVEPTLNHQEVTLRTLMNCFSHPTVISLVANLLQENLNS